MILVSSHRPFGLSEEYARNQERAAKANHALYNVNSMYYVGHFEEGLVDEKVQFVKPEGDFPTIKELAEFASHMTEFTAIINADIVLGSNISDVEKKMRDMALPAGTSYRYEFQTGDYPNMDNAIRHKEDRGMDIFIASPAIWKNVAKDVPENLWFSHNYWDTWVCGYFCHHLGYGFRHFTDYRCVFHPKHGGRQQPLLDKITTTDPYLTRAKRPSPL